MSIHPIVKLRQELGFSRVEMARWLGVNYFTLAQCELGYQEHLKPRVLSALARAGYDVAQLQAEYVTWRCSVMIGRPVQA